MKSLRVSCCECGAILDVEVPKNPRWGGARPGCGRKKNQLEKNQDFILKTQKNQDDLISNANKLNEKMDILLSQKNQLEKNQVHLEKIHLENNQDEKRQFREINARLSDLQRRPTHSRDKREVVPPLEHPANGELTPRERDELARMKAKHKGAGRP